MKLKKFFLIFFILILPIFCKAEEVFEYFSHSPRTTNKLDLNLVEEIKQEIKIFDDNLSKIYLWIDNPGTANEVNIQLFEEDHLLFSKTINIPQVKGGYFGYKFGIDLGKNLKIESGKNYHLSIKNLTKDEMYIYYTSKIEILQGEEKEGILPISLGKFLINGKEYAYSLKIALAESLEQDAPKLFNPQIEIESPYKVHLLFNSNEPIKYKVIYWDVNRNETYLIPSNPYLENCFIETKKCKISIYTNHNTYYKFQISIIDYWGNFKTYEGEFVTPLDPTISTSTISTSTIKINDTSLPQISNFQIKEITSNNIIVSFETNEFALSSLKIFYKDTGVIVMEIRNSMFNLYHEISALNLLFPNLEYEGVVYVEDIFKNKNEYKFSFKTKEGKTSQSLDKFLSQPKILEINVINEGIESSLKTPDIEINYDQNLNKMNIKTDSNNLKINFIKRPEVSIFSYSIKEGSYDLDLNIFSPGVYNYLAYQELRPNIKQILKSGEIEIKSKEIKEISSGKIETKNNTEIKIKEGSPKIIQPLPASESVSSHKKIISIIGIIVILSLLLILFLIKRK